MATRTQEMVKTLLFDIETAPNLGAYFNPYTEGNIVWTENHWYILSFAWKWLGEKKVKVCSLPDFKKTYAKDKCNDIDVVKELWGLFDEADVIVAHNGVAFDSKKVKARFLVHGLRPPEPSQEVDTLLIAKRYFKFDSNSLNNLSEFLGLGSKLPHHGFKLWKDCMDGDRKAWRLMCKYNAQDVTLLEKVYLRFRPYIRNHPNVALMNGDLVACPNCGSKNVIREGVRWNRVTSQQQFRCKDCNSWHSRPIPKDEEFPKQMR
jgi:DNA polymerase elongation subunit (family B)